MSTRIEKSSNLKVKDEVAFNYMCSFIYDLNTIYKNIEAKVPNLVFDVNKFLNDNGFIQRITSHDLNEDSRVNVSVNENEMEILFETYDYFFTEYEFIAFVLSRKFPRIEIEIESDTGDEYNESSHVVTSTIKNEKVIKQTIYRWYDNDEEGGCTTSIETNDPAYMENIEEIYCELLNANSMVKNKIKRYRLLLTEIAYRKGSQYFWESNKEVNNINEIMEGLLIFKPVFIKNENSLIEELIEKRDFQSLENEAESLETKSYFNILNRVKNAQFEECYFLIDELVNLLSSIGVEDKIELQEMTSTTYWHNPYKKEEDEIDEEEHNKWLESISKEVDDDSDFEIFDIEEK